MVEDPNPIIAKVAEKRKALEAAKKALKQAEKRVETAQIELGVWEEAAALASKQPSSDAGSDGGTRQRALSEGWKKIIGAMVAQHPRVFTLANVADLCVANGVPANPETIRSQMHLYTTKDELFERVEPGKFLATLKASQVTGVTLGLIGPDQDPETETAGDDPSSPAAQ